MTRRIEFVEQPFVKIGRDTWYAGDVKTFPKAEADEYIRLGWAKDAETGEIGERKPGVRSIKINPDPVIQTVSG